MQIKLFTIPILGGEQLTADLNAFLRSRKILQVESELERDGTGAFWCFCIKYIDRAITKTKNSNTKIDYKEVLDEATFQRFSELRSIRKTVAQEHGVPAYAVLTNEELASLAKSDKITLATMRDIPGIGEKKLEKYGHYFLPTKQDEES